MIEPLISLVTSAYRSDQYLEAYFQSVCAQTIFGRMEVILILNDPSAEACAIAEMYLTRYPEQIRITKVLRETIGVSTNRGYRQAMGRFLAYADVDDTRTPDCYERQAEVLESNPNCDFTYGDFVVVDAPGKREGRLVNVNEFDRIELMRSSMVGANHFFRRELLDRCGYWDEQLHSGGDFDFQVRAAFNSTFKKTGGGPLFFYTRFPNSGSASSNLLQPIERTAIELRYGAYDKTMELKGYPYINAARGYVLDKVLIHGEWRPLSAYVPGYNEMMRKHEPARRQLAQRYRLWLLRHYLTLPTRSLYRISRPVLREGLDRLGWLEDARRLRDLFRSQGSSAP